MDADLELDVLRILRLVGFADGERLADRAGVPAEAAALAIDRLAGSGHVLLRSGRVGGWTLTALGRDRLATLTRAEVDAAGARGPLEAVYQRFLVLNPAFLELCTDWQLRAGGDVPVVNDHAEAEYDRVVIERLVDIDHRIQALMADATATLPRFAAYRTRLAAALARVVAGEIDWFTRPVLDSYHTVWFELHEDLLATLGLGRSDER